MLNQPGKLWRVVGSSVRGASHLKADVPCQDAHEWQTPEPSLLIAAVADGAGSARESQTGARMACRSAVDFLTRDLTSGTDDWPEKLRAATSAARDAVLREAERMKLPARELASTLIVLAATPGQACAAQVGDGAALVLGSNNELCGLTLPPESEYLNETVFLTSDDASEKVQIKEANINVRGVALLTDGLQMLALKMPQRAPHKPFFDPLFRFVEKERDAHVRLEQIERFLQSPKITQRADDDLTLLVAMLC